MIDKNKLENLYKSGKSMFDISKILKCSPHKIVYWMKKYDLKRRSRSEAGYIQQNPDGDPFKIRTKLNSEQTFLFGLGLGIYWGEGTKKSKHSLRVTNTDPNIIKYFIRFLLEICQLKKEKLSFSLISFNDIKTEVVRDYWSKQLKISPKKFGKITIIPSQGKGTYKRKSQFGVCTVHANNIKLRNWLFSELDKLKKPD